MVLESAGTGSEAVMSPTTGWSMKSTTNGVFGKGSYHAKNVPSLLQATVLARNGIYHTGISNVAHWHVLSPQKKKKKKKKKKKL